MFINTEERVFSVSVCAKWESSFRMSELNSNIIL
jgi:hypothetical protein